MAKKEIVKEKVEEVVIAQPETVQDNVVVSGRQLIKQKLEDHLNGKCLFDVNDLKEVLQYL